MKIKKIINELNNNKYIEITKFPNYYDDIYNFIYSNKINTSKNDKKNILENS